MEKLMISLEEEQALETYNYFIEAEEKSKNPLLYFLENSSNWNSEFSPLKRFTVQEFALLLCGWYEVKSAFEVGDWIFNKISERYSKLISVDNGSIATVYSSFSLGYAKEYIEKVTEPYKIAMLEAGRKKPELREGDLIALNDDTTYKYKGTGGYSDQRIKEFLECGAVKRLYLLEHAIQLIEDGRD